LLYINECKENIMWRKVVDWYREWEEEQIAVLEQPELASRAPAGYRRFHARKLAERSPVERQQLRAFSVALKGWRGWLFTAALVVAFTVCGALLHLALPGTGWVTPIVTANVLGIALSFGLFGAWFNYRQLVRRKFRLLLTVVLYALLSAVALSGGVLWISDQSPGAVMDKLPRVLAMILGAGVALAVPMLMIGVLRNRQHAALTGQLQRDAERDRLARELSESQLRLLRAQIEPHFLFNTLGAVQQLAEHGAPRAAALTADLIDFLRASLSEMRSEQVGLAAEFGLVESYLRVMRARLGERLRFSLALPAALEDVQVPSMIVLTLVENAIKHGIEPALRGGEVTVSAEVADGALRVRVRDSGVGMAAQPGAGTGLDNVRRRLQLAYGAQAGLALHDADPGVVADLTIALPGPKR
jgi:signal transduction histidine kinase